MFIFVLRLNDKDIINYSNVDLLIIILLMWLSGKILLRKLCLSSKVGRFLGFRHHIWVTDELVALRPI